MLARRDPANFVTSVVPGYSYLCTTISACDANLRHLRMMADCSSIPTRRDESRQDIDRVLDRRCYLMLTDSA